MVIVKPGDTVVQARGDVVVYRLPFEDWSADLERPENKEARITQRAITGELVQIKALDYTPGSQAQEVRVTSGTGKKKGLYQIIRTVKSATEVRVRSFNLQVTP